MNKKDITNLILEYKKEGYTNNSIVKAFNRDGIRTSNGKDWTVGNLQSFIYRQGVLLKGDKGDG